MVQTPRIQAVPRSRRWRAAAPLVIAACLLASVPAMAAAPAKPARLGLCAACHGETGMAQIPAAPNLAGQKLDYLREALRQYRDGRRNVPLMRTVIGPVSDADLDELARWYSAQTPSSQGNP
ncbi:cytochrome C [Dyella solisilvae]|uniref:Cytochrome C n=2 Tax=Dyella solisilvae TaxID=1920168 RepID=A0A370K7C3_9GAMM|nr:cytochrome C [Dyella solisilvae]